MELEPSHKSEGEFMTSGDILEYLRHVDNSKYFTLLSRTKPEHIGHCLRQLNYIKTSGSIKKNDACISLYGYYVKKLEKQPF